MNMHFKQIEAEDIEVLTGFFLLRDNWTCDSVFLDTFLWKDMYRIHYRISDLRDKGAEGKAVQWLILEDDHVSTSVPLCSEHDLPIYFKEQEEYFNTYFKMKMEIFLADENAVNALNLDPEKYRVEEEEDLGDYIYDAKCLRELPGNAYRKKRNHLNAFYRDYAGRYEYRELTCEDKADILTCESAWLAGKEELDEHMLLEHQGFVEILDHCKALNIDMGGVYIDGELKAFAIGSYNPRLKMSLVHIEKADPDIRGLYPFINQQFQIHQYPDAEFVNREDDMGLPGLRQAKQSYLPVKMARKFNIYQL